MTFGDNNYDFDALLKCDFEDDKPIQEFDFDPLTFDVYDSFHFTLSPIDLSSIPSSSIEQKDPPQIQPQIITQAQAQKIMTFEEFNKYIYSKIDPDQAILVTKEMLMKIEKAFIEDFKQDWIKLSRDDKRKKERVIRGLYENCNLIYQNLEANPDKYLRYVKESIISKYSRNN